MIVHQNIGTFDITMKKVVSMTVAEAIQQLSHDVCNVRLGQHDQARFEQAHKIVVHVLEDQVEGTLVPFEVESILLVSDNLAQIDNVLVI